MGLDMMLFKVKRVKGLTLKQILTTAEYIEYMDNPKSNNCTFKEWCGCDEKDVDKSKMGQIKELFHEEKIGNDFSYQTILDEVAYWRKANAIHGWFVDHVQNGVDDCGDYEVTKEQLEELLETTNKVLDASELVSDQVYNGETYGDDGWKTNYIEGKVIKDPKVAMELLPTQRGFFFGGTDYDQWYHGDLLSTKEQLEKILKETDFENEIVYYSSSW